MKTNLDVNDDEWDSFVGNSLRGHHEQTSGYGKVRTQNSYEHCRIALKNESGEITVGAQLLVRKIPVIGHIAYIPQGPILGNNSTLDDLERFTILLDHYSRQQSFYRVRILNYSLNSTEVGIIKANGYIDAGSAWSPNPSVYLECNKDEKEIWTGLKPGCRNSINRAIKNGVECQVSQTFERDAFEYLLATTASRKSFKLFPFDYYEYVFKLLSDNNRAYFILSQKNRAPLSVVIMTIIGKTAYYAWGGADTGSGETTANYLSQWNAIKTANNLGCEIYNLSGGAIGNDGVSAFKRKWGTHILYYPLPMDKYYGIQGSLVRYGTNLCSKNKNILSIANKLDYRLRNGSMPF